MNVVIEKKATREGFGEGLLDAARENNKIYAITADLAGSVGMTKFSEEFPTRFVDVGVAEQNLVTVCAGLALGGKIPFAAAFAAFSPGRNWEQIRTTICYNDQNVKIVGSHAGLGVGEDGATHQMLEDVALMRVLPNMDVIVPCDSIQAKKATIAIAKTNKPTYLRVFRQKTPILTTEDTEFKIGKIQLFSKGKDVVIISTGPILANVMDSSKQLEKSKIFCTIINCHTIKPLDEENILKHVSDAKLVVVVEDHQIAGGLGGAIAELLSKNNPKKMLFLGINDVFGESGTDVELYKKYKLDSQGITDSIISELFSKNKIKNKIKSEIKIQNKIKIKKNNVNNINKQKINTRKLLSKNKKRRK
ncbi:MAG: transketolase C-terminal domain-containing protein [Candidatus Woesearchaeota archaeon]